MPTVNVHRSCSELESLQPVWNGLANGVPFRQWEWTHSWWRHFQDKNTLFVLSVTDGEQCIGIAPFYVCQETAGSVLRMIGDDLACSDHLSLLSLPNNANRVAASLAEWLSLEQEKRSGDRSGPDWDMMQLEGLDGSCPAMSAFLEAVTERGFLVRQSSTINTWRLSLPPSMDEYLAMLAKKYRQRVRNSLRRLAADCEATIVREGNEFDERWEQLIELHARRRNSLGDSGSFAELQFSNFLRDATAAFREKGKIELACIRTDDKPIAIELCFLGDSTTFAYQVGIDPDSLKQSPGWLVNTAAVQSAIGRGQAGLDWCRGDEDYKRRLGAVPSPCLNYRIVPPRLRSQLWDAALVGKSTVKDWVKTGLNATGMRS